MLAPAVASASVIDCGVLKVTIGDGEKVGGSVTFATDLLSDPVIDGFAVSVAVRLCVPPVFRVATNEPMPFTTVSAGSTACGSELVKCTLPL